jgi:hypothetical protein
MHLERYLDQVHARVQGISAVQYLAAFTRLLLAVGFVAPGLHKAVGHPFITPGAYAPDHPLRLFFDAFFSSSQLYVFVGVVQATAGVLLLFHRTAPLGAILYLPVISNIFLVTLGLPFGTTRYIAGAMLLGSVFLVCWYYPAWKRVAFPEQYAVPKWRNPKALSIACTSWYALAIAGIMITLVMRSVIPMAPFYSLSWLILAAALVLGLIACVVNGMSSRRRAAQQPHAAIGER